MDKFVEIYKLKKLGFKKKPAARKLDIDVKTVRKYWDMTDKDYADYLKESGERSRIMNPYNGFIIGKLKEYPDVTSAQIYDWLREAYTSFEPSYSTVRLHVRHLRESEGIPKAVNIRQYQAVEELPFGFQAQVDMGSRWQTDIYGKRVRVYIFCMSMSASRNKFIYLRRNPFNTNDFVYAHDLAFKYFDGRPKEIVYDQDRVLCVSENAGNVLFTDGFRAYQMYCGFVVRLCRAADPESKGKIEAVVKYVQNNFLKHRVFTTIENLNAQGLDWLDRTGNGLPHNVTKLVPKVVFEEERKHLAAAPALEDENKAGPSLYLVRKDNVISYRSNRYALPIGTYAPGKQVYAAETDDTLEISDMKGVLIVKHALCRERGKLIRLTRPERAAYTKHRLLFEEVLKAFGGGEQVKAYLEKNWELYPRYMKDQFIIFKKAAESYAAEELSRALDYCAGREIYSATDFRDTLVYFQSLQPEPPVLPEVTIPEKYSAVMAQERDINVYAQIYGGILK